MARHVSKEELTAALANSLSMSDVIRAVGLPYNGKSAKRLNELFRQYEIDVSVLSPTARTKLRIKYPTVEKSCPMCGKSFETKSGHPKESTCCSRQCSNKFFATPLDKEHKLRIQASVVRFHEQNGSRRLIRCEQCGSIIHGGKNRTFCSDTCKNISTAHHERLSIASHDAVMKRVANGTHAGWKSRKGKLPSYPETFFMRVLSNNNIPYERDLPAGRWFIDFAIEEKKIALEIDGKQHEWAERKAKDAEKDEYLTSTGWRVHRIKWKSINTEKGKLYIKNEIDKFLELYRNVA